MKDCLIALDIGGTFLKACLFDGNGALIPDSFDSEPANSNGETEEVKQAYQTLLRRLKGAAEARGYEVKAVAADTPGPFDYAAATSRMTHKYTAIYGVPLRPWFFEVLGRVPVCFLHDSSAFLYGAAAAHPEFKNVAGVMIGTGLGFAVMKDGEILTNENGGPAYSIFKLPYRGKTAEDYVSARGTLNRYNETAKTPAASAKEVAVRAENGDADAIRMFDDTGKHLAKIVRPILEECGTEALFLGGQVSKSFDFFGGALKKGLEGLPALKIVESAENLDLVHLIGVKEWFCRTRPDEKLAKPYPMKLRAVLKDIIWGGTLLGTKFGKGEGKIAEAWELAVHPEGDNVIENGAFAGLKLSEYLGSAEHFPLMIKLIDACDRLSIQVHPVKTEMWYVLDAEPGAKLVYGLKEKFNESAFRKALEEGTVESLLREVPVKPGDVFFIPQGLVHAIGAGILIAEIQENSNVTYRVYDYGRLKDGKPRELHVDAAMKTIRDFTEEEIGAARFSLGKDNDLSIANCPLFSADHCRVDGEFTIPAAKPFTSLICVDGEGTLSYDTGTEPVRKGDSFFLPEDVGTVKAEGKMELFLTTVPENAG